MEAKELRLGNYLNYRDKERILIVSNLGSFRFETVCHNTGIIYGSDDASEYNGIPLTEEWLLKFGFEKKTSSFVIYPVSIKKQTKDAFFYTPASLHLEYVHQLQNLYFALTGEELSIK